MSELELLQLHADAMTELGRRGVVRTQNNPLGDYAEWLVAKALDLELATSSKAGYDAETADGDRVQVKARRLMTPSANRQLGAIRNYQAHDFDQLAVVLFDSRFSLLEGYLMPREVVGDYAVFREHQNAHILVLSGSVISDARVIDITEKLHASSAK